METQCEIEQYSQRILWEVGNSFQIDIRCEQIAEEVQDKYYSKILKSGIVTNGNTFITSVTIYLNYKKLDTIPKVRRAISHELAHLFPSVNILNGFKAFTARWSYWNDNLKFFEKQLEEYTHQTERQFSAIEDRSNLRLL